MEGFIWWSFVHYDEGKTLFLLSGTGQQKRHSSNLDPLQRTLNRKMQQGRKPLLHG